MPYFVYRIENHPIRLLRKLGVFEAFKEASGYAKEARAGLSPSAQVKVIFAEHELQAEDLLSTPREAKIIGDDD